MFRRILLSGVTLISGFLFCAPSVAQDAFVRQLYGQGVHAYHAGNMSEARRLLDESINAGSKDPRAYYFRAFTKMRGGSSLDAQSDISTGAGYEVGGYSGYDIGRSLERVQGSHRLQFETLRSEAKLAAQRARRYRSTSPSYGGGVLGDGSLGGGIRSDGSAERTIDLPAVPGGGVDPTDPFDGNEDVPPNPFNEDAPVDATEPEPADEGLFGGDEGNDDVTAPAEAEDEGLFGGDEAGMDDTAPADDGGLFGDDTGADTAPADDSGLFGGDDAPVEPEPVDDGGLFGGDDAGAAAPDPAPAGDATPPADDGGALDSLFGGDEGGAAGPADGGGAEDLDSLFE